MYYIAGNMSKHVSSLSYALPDVRTGFVRQIFYILRVCRGTKLLLLWVSTDTEEGSMGSKSSFLGLWPLFCSQAESGQLRWVACWAAEGWIKGRADVFPVPLLSSALHSPVCLLMTSAHLCSSQLTTASSSTFPSRPVSAHLPAAGARKTRLQSGPL